MDAIKEEQKIANEILFLRYLQLDSSEESEAIASGSNTNSSKHGRTPLTITKRLINPGKSEFGFSVVWTHPPKIDEVEKGSSADCAGILPGDYIIFVDKNNVVDMQEEEIINMIRYYGGLLTLEIFRKSSANGVVPKVEKKNNNSISLSTSITLHPSGFDPISSKGVSLSKPLFPLNLLNSKALRQAIELQNASMSTDLPINFIKKFPSDRKSNVCDNRLSTAEMKELQKLADEFLFLRYLKLDPSENSGANSQIGRTPLTLTKQLINPGNSEFGFSIILTHPPRIDEVEKGSPAESAGILQGDYIIFVDKNNVVEAHEEEIMNLIRYCGSLLFLEIFRKNGPKNVEQKTDCEDILRASNFSSACNFKDYSIGCST